MECKFDTAEREAYKIGELIDTLWNVNLYLPKSTTIHHHELIDTLWNVNKFVIILKYFSIMN